MNRPPFKPSAGDDIRAALKTTLPEGVEPLLRELMEYRQKDPRHVVGTIRLLGYEINRLQSKLNHERRRRVSLYKTFRVVFEALKKLSAGGFNDILFDSLKAASMDLETRTGDHDYISASLDLMEGIAKADSARNARKRKEECDSHQQLTA